MHTMPRGKLRPTLEEVKALLSEDQDFLRPLVQAVLQELLEAEMTEALGAAKGERPPDRLGYRAGCYPRTLVTRVGKPELRMPQDRQGRFSTELFERYQRSEKALVAALAEMYVQGVSTRKVKANAARDRRGTRRCACPRRDDQRLSGPPRRGQFCAALRLVRPPGRCRRPGARGGCRLRSLRG
jgi:Transposase, Mutator family